MAKAAWKRHCRFCIEFNVLQDLWRLGHPYLGSNSLRIVRKADESECGTPPSVVCN